MPFTGGGYALYFTYHPIEDAALHTHVYGDYPADVQEAFHPHEDEINLPGYSFVRAGERGLELPFYIGDHLVEQSI